MEIFIAINGAKAGPLTLFQIRQKLENGEIGPDTLGWMRGESGWKPLKEIPVTMELIQELERAKLDEDLKKDPGPVPEREGSIAQRMPSHSFARFAARMFDVMLVQVIVTALVDQPELSTKGLDWSKPTPEMVSYSLALFMIHAGSVLLWHFLEIFSLSMFGTTPGKALFKLRVQLPNGQNLPIHLAMARSVLVWVFGMGLGIEMIQYFANLVAYFRVQRRGVAVWDGWLGTEVQQSPVTRERMLTVMILFLTLVVLLRFM